MAVKWRLDVVGRRLGTMELPGVAVGIWKRGRAGRELVVREWLSEGGPGGDEWLDGEGWTAVNGSLVATGDVGEGWPAVAGRPAVVAGGSMAVKWRLDVVGRRLGTMELPGVAVGIWKRGRAGRELVVREWLSEGGPGGGKWLDGEGWMAVNDSLVATGGVGEGWLAVAGRPAVVAGGSMAVKWRLDVVGRRLGTMELPGVAVGIWKRGRAGRELVVREWLSEGGPGGDEWLDGEGWTAVNGSLVATCHSPPS
ncbi:hypothetical protein Dimus_029331 [Dionaea muscipula]